MCFTDVQIQTVSREVNVMKKILLYSAVVIAALIICFRPVGFINTMGNGKVDIDFERAEISAVIREKTDELEYSEREIDLPDDIIEVITTLKPIRYVESMVPADNYKITLDDGENRFEVIFYINMESIDEIAAVRKIDENGDIEWLWENEITKMDKLNEILS